MSPLQRSGSKLGIGCSSTSPSRNLPMVGRPLDPSGGACEIASWRSSNPEQSKPDSSSRVLRTERVDPGSAVRASKLTTMVRSRGQRGRGRVAAGPKRRRIRPGCTCPAETSSEGPPEALDRARVVAKHEHEQGIWELLAQGVCSQDVPRSGVAVPTTVVLRCQAFCESAGVRGQIGEVGLAEGPGDRSDRRASDVVGEVETSVLAEIEHTRSRAEVAADHRRSGTRRAKHDQCPRSIGALSHRGEQHTR